MNQKPWANYCQTNITLTAQTSEFGSPNRDTPQPNGDILMSVINGNWGVLFSPSGKTLGKARAPDIPNNGCQYVADAQMLTDGNVQVADYAGPTQNLKGCTGTTCASGNGAPTQRQHHSERHYNDRTVVIDPKTDQIVWQYGHTGQPGAGSRLLQEVVRLAATAPTRPKNSSTGSGASATSSTAS